MKELTPFAIIIIIILFLWLSSGCSTARPHTSERNSPRGIFSSQRLVDFAVKKEKKKQKSTWEGLDEWIEWQRRVGNRGYVPPNLPFWQEDIDKRVFHWGF